MRSKQEADVEEQGRIFRNDVAEAEADTGDQNALLCGLLLESFVDVRAQLVHIELRRVDDKIGKAPNRAEMAAFFLERGFYRLIRAERMRTARFAEAAQQHRVRSFEKN